jgi:hypothetical protein
MGKSHEIPIYIRRLDPSILRSILAKKFCISDIELTLRQKPFQSLPRKNIRRLERESGQRIIGLTNMDVVWYFVRPDCVRSRENVIRQPWGQKTRVGVIREIPIRLEVKQGFQLEILSV